jgi:predicted MPP superfamily phosphohydrolase
VWRIVVLGLSLLLHGYVAVRLLPALAPWSWAPPALLVLLFASYVLMPLGLMFGRLRAHWTSVIWAGYLLMGLFSSLFVLTLLREAVLLLGLLANALWPGSFDWPGLITRSALLVPVLALVVTVAGFFGARRVPAIVRIDVPLANLPDGLRGFTIAQISDVHVGPTIRRRYLGAVVAAVNRLDADLVAVTGDLVDGSVADLAGEVAPIAALVSRHGTYFVTGNHEYYSGVGEWIVELRRLGVRVLMNEHVVLEHRGAQLVVAGVTDISAHHFEPAHRSDPQAALAGAPRGAALRLLLAHQPRSAGPAAAAGFELQLSGHTHGGQFLPWNFFVRLQQPYTAGLHRLRSLWVYTSSGTGYWGPPKRFGIPSEITFLTLVQASTAPATGAG